jgi:type IV pilus assembly protein PilO
MATPAAPTPRRIPLAGQIGIGTVLAALVAGGYYVTLHTDVSSKIDQAHRQTSDLESQLAQARQAQASYIADRDELQMRQQRQKEVNKILPAETEAASFLSALQQVSNIAGIDLKSWAPMEEKTETFFAKVPMKLEITGKFHQIAKFMYEVGKQDRIINMENVDLSDPKLEGDEVTLKARVLATTFHLLKAKPGAAPAQPGQPGQQPAQPGQAPIPQPAPMNGGAK